MVGNLSPKSASMTDLNSPRVIGAIKIPNGATISRKQIDHYTKFVSIYGAKGLAYIKMNEDGPASPILKFLGAAVTQSIIDKVDAKTGDIE
jgi:aspartyl-tRNA synthetase